MHFTPGFLLQLAYLLLAKKPWIQPGNLSRSALTLMFPFKGVKKMLLMTKKMKILNSIG